MDIAVLGTGNVGGALGAGWAAKGHNVVFGSRDPGSEKVRTLLATAGENARAATIAEAASSAGFVVLATPWNSVEEVLAAAGDLNGKILIDCINPINATFTGLDLGFDTSGSERIAELAPGARVVKAFNTVSAATMLDAAYGEHAANMFYCGDDEQAKATLNTMACELGLEAVDAGDLQMARYLEPLAMFYIKLAGKQKWGGNCALKILTR